MSRSLQPSRRASSSGPTAEGAVVSVGEFWAWMSAWAMSPGFGGLAALAAAAVAYRGAVRSIRNQRASTRKEQWWDRARWALDLTLSESGEERAVGFAVLEALASSEWAEEHETDVIAAATEPTLEAYEDQGESADLDSGAQWRHGVLAGGDDDDQEDD